MLGGLGVGGEFTLSQDESTQFSREFSQLPSAGGKVTAEIARTFFMRSGLPNQILGQIWILSDNDKDGALNQKEFCVAMKLVRMALTKQQLPSSIPAQIFGQSHLGNQGMGINPNLTGNAGMSMGMTPSYPQMRPILTGPASTYHSPMTPMNPGALGPPMMTPTITTNSSTPSSYGLNLDLNFGQSKPMTSSSAMPVSSSAPVGTNPSNLPHDWTITPAQKSKLNQNFNTHDISKSGFIEGTRARGILMDTGLPQPTLAKIWQQADQDGDGKLSRQEFIAAMCLCEAAKKGVPIPEKLPDALAGSGMGGSASGKPRSFEDERRENMERGRMELERRRQAILAEQEAARREEEKRRKEREEEEERKRQEAERKRQEELERQRKIQEEEERKRREEQERQYKMEIESKRQQMLTEKTRIEETLSRLRHQHDQLRQEKEAQLETERDTRKRRDEIRMRLQGANDTLSASSSKTARDKAEISTMEAHLTASRQEVERIRLRKLQVTQELEQKRREKDVSDITRQCETADAILKETKETSRKHRIEIETETTLKTESIESIKKMNEMLGKDPYDGLPEELRPKIVQSPPQQSAFPSNGFGGDAFGSSPGFGNQGFGGQAFGGQAFGSPTQTDGFGSAAPTMTPNDNGWSASAWPQPQQNLKKFIAGFDFDARSPDELSFRDGDIIEVDLEKECEPEWFYGHLNGQSGLFPQPYVTAMEDDSQAMNSSFTPVGNQFGEMNLGQQAPANETVLETVTAAHPFKSDEARHMSFAAGESIEVLEKQDDWWRGQLPDGSNGWFPKTYVTSAPIAPKKKAPSRPAPGGPPSAVAAAAPASQVSKGVVFIAAYDFQGQEATDLSFSAGERIQVISQEGEWWTGINQAGIEGIFPSAFVEDPAALAEQPIVVTAQFDYPGSSPEDLTFNAGDLITVIDRDDPNWWHGRLENGKSGTFPSNFVSENNDKSPPAPAHVDEEISYPPQTQEPAHVYQNIQSFGNDPFAAQTLAIEETPAFDDPFGNAPMNTQPPAANDDWANGLDQFEDDFGGTAEYSAPPVASDDPWGNQQGQTVAQTNDDPWGQTQQTYDAPPAYQQPDTPGWNTPFGNTKMDGPFGPSSSSSQNSAWDELVNTERQYYEQLEFVFQTFQPALQVAGLTTILSNWAELVENSQLLIMMLESSSSPSTFAESLSENFISAYTTYCATQKSSSNLLRQRRDGDSGFDFKLTKLEEDPRNKGMNLQAHLLNPLQRITKYPVLLENAKKINPNLEGIDAALAKANRLVSAVNANVAIIEDATQIDWLVTHVIHKGELPPGLASVLYSGVLRKKKKSTRVFMAFLCKDERARLILILTTSKTPLLDPKGIFQSDTRLELYRKPLTVQTVTDVPGDIFSFEIHGREGRVILKADTPEERNAWVQKVRQPQ